MKKIKSFCKRYISRTAMIFLAVTAVSLIVFIIAKNSRPFADFINGTLSFVFRWLMSMLSLLLPFSLFEFLLLSILPLLTVLIVIAVKRGLTWLRAVRGLFLMLGIVGIIFSGYALALGIPYNATPINERMGLSEDTDITTEELVYTATELRNEVNALAEQMHFSNTESRVDWSMSELSGILVDAYDAVLEKYDICTNFHSRVKPILFSSFMSDTGLTGIYTYFTGEANVNIEYPDYRIIFTAAHEMAHQRGIIRENEANFMAFLVCINSDEPYVRYSGYLNMYEYVSSALYKTDKDAYYEVISELCGPARADMIASSEVYEKHKDSWIRQIVSGLNDSYLKLNGTDGKISYGYVVRLAVSYYKE